MFSMFGQSKMPNIGNNLVDTTQQDNQFPGLYNYISSMYGDQQDKPPISANSGTIPLIAPVSESQPFQLQKSQGIGSLLGSLMFL